MKKRITILMFVITAFVAGSVVSTVTAQEHIMFMPHWKAQAQFAGYYVAKENGFYQEEGLEVDIVHPKTTQSMLDIVQSNTSQVVVMSLFQALEACKKGWPVVNILQTSMNTATMIVARKDKFPLQKGARVGTWFYFDALTQGISHREQLDYEWVPMTSSVSMFIRGGIDAMIAMSYNEYYQLLQTGVELPEEAIFRMSEHGYNVQEEGVYMPRDYYISHKQQAEKFAKASRRGWEWAAEHPKETLDIVMRYVHKDKVGTNRVLQQLMLQEILRLQIDKQSGQREFRLRPDMVKLANELITEAGVEGKEVTYEQLIGQ